MKNKRVWLLIVGLLVLLVASIAALSPTVAHAHRTQPPLFTPTPVPTPTALPLLASPTITVDYTVVVVVLGLAIAALLFTLFMLRIWEARPRRLSAIIIGTIAFLIATVTIAPEPINITRTASDSERINITRTEYEAALAKWKAQNVLEYEITTETHAWLGGRSKLRVSDGGKSIIAYDVYSDPGATPRPPWTPEPDMHWYYAEDTVEGMFADVEAMLNEAIVIKAASMSGQGRFYMVYTLSFHPELGYPTYMSGEAFFEPGAYMTHTDWAKEVTDFKPLKYGPPEGNVVGE
jgi:hypothetical protein